MSARDDQDPGDDPLARLTVIGLAAGRIAIGAGIWLAPGASSRALGLPALDAGGLALGRLAASRDLALGAWQLAALGDPSQTRRAAATAAAIDGADALTFALALRAGGAGRTAGIRGLAAAVPATLAGAWVARRLGSG